MTSFAESLAVPPTPVRCMAMCRTERGWEACHRSQHPDTEPHHVKDRSWYSGQYPRMRLMVPCGEACGWPDYVVPYFGSAPRHDSGGPRGYVAPMRPVSARRPETPGRSHHGRHS